MKIVSPRITFVVCDALLRASRPGRYDLPGSRWVRPLKLVPCRFDRLSLYYVKRGQLEMAFRVNAEISFARGNLYSPLNWQSRVLLAGIQSAYMRKLDRAANWLSRGVSLQKGVITARSKSYGFPLEFVEWLQLNEDRIQTPEGWKEIFRNDPIQENFERLLIYIGILGLGLGFREEIMPMLGPLQSPDSGDLKKVIYSRSYRNLNKRDSILNHEELFKGRPSDISTKITTNLVSRTFSPFAETGTLLSSDEFDWIAVNGVDRYPVDHVGLQASCQAVHSLARGDHEKARTELSDSLSAGCEFIDRLDNRLGPRKLFIGGFGWTGSSAVFDAFRGYPEVKEMPGAGKVPYLNEGADSEPMLHQGPAGVLDLSREFRSCGALGNPKLEAFLRLYVLTDLHHSYFEYKTVHANRRIRDILGESSYYYIINRFLYEYSLLLDRFKTVACCKKSKKNDMLMHAERTQVFSALGRRLVNALFPNDDDIVIFNNSISTENVFALGSLGPRSSYISVNRNILDQMADQRRSNVFFRSRAIDFAYSKYKKISNYRKGQKEVKESTEVQFFDINFEDWVRSETIRRTVTENIIGYYDPERESRHFRAEHSLNNIDIYDGVLTRIEVGKLNCARRFLTGL